MGKLESNKQQKRTSLLDTAFKLFTTQGVSKTSIAEISQKAGIAKGTFYLYFKDKYDIRNKLISHEASKLFKNAATALNRHIYEETAKNAAFTISFTNQIVFIADHIINALNDNQTLLNFKDVYYDMLSESGLNLKEPEIMLFMIVELISSTCYSAILYKEPADIDTLKPYLYNTIRAIINEHTISN